jgi:hypothetical protein
MSKAISLSGCVERACWDSIQGILASIVRLGESRKRKLQLLDAVSI